jgi:hypothetical protein
MKLQPIVRIIAISVLLCAGVLSDAQKATAQIIDFGQIDSDPGDGDTTRRIPAEDNRR